MIKGVNKQIVEINYTKNDYFEKAILIINPSKSCLPKEIISKKADDYMKTLIHQKAGEKNRKILSSAKTPQSAVRKQDKPVVLTAVVLVSGMIILILLLFIFMKMGA